MFLIVIFLWLLFKIVVLNLLVSFLVVLCNILNVFKLLLLYGKVINKLIFVVLNCFMLLILNVFGLYIFIKWNNIGFVLVGFKWWLKKFFLEYLKFNILMVGNSWLLFIIVFLGICKCIIMKLVGVCVFCFLLVLVCFVLGDFEILFEIMGLLLCCVEKFKFLNLGLLCFCDWIGVGFDILEVVLFGLICFCVGVFGLFFLCIDYKLWINKLLMINILIMIKVYFNFLVIFLFLLFDMFN